MSRDLKSSFVFMVGFVALLVASALLFQPAEATVVDTTQITQESRGGLGNAMFTFGEDLATEDVFETGHPTAGDRYPILFVWGAGVCVTCAADSYIVHWQGAAAEITIDTARGTITDTCATTGCGNDGTGAGVFVPAGGTKCWRIIQASLRDPLKAGRRDGVCEDAQGSPRGRPCAADADCRVGVLPDDWTCETAAGSFENTTGTFLAGSAACRGHIES